MKLGYMVSAYPARSHTFIRREIEELEKRGFSVARYSQRKYDKSEILNDAEAAEYQRTWSIFPLPFVALCLCHLRVIAGDPRRYFSTLKWSVVRRPPGASGLMYALIYFIQAIYLAEQMRADDVQLVHAHFVNSGGYVAAIAARFLALPWGASVHGRSDFDFPGVHALAWVLKDADFLRCVSSFGASQAMRQCTPDYWHKIVVCYCGMPDSLIDKQAIFKRGRQPATLLSVGRLSAEKGQYLLLKAASLLKSKGYACKLLIVGDGPDRQRLHQAVDTMHINDVCVFLGAVDEARVMQEMAAADVFVCPSLMEGLPQVLMEAMAVRVPVVAPYLAGIPELVGHKETGMLYPAGDVQQMAEAVASLLDDQALAQRCADSGYQRLTQQFVLSTTVQPLAETLQRIIDQRASS